MRAFALKAKMSDSVKALVAVVGGILFFFVVGPMCFMVLIRFVLDPFAEWLWRKDTAHTSERDEGTRATNKS